MLNHKELAELIAKKSILHGEFKLSSGRTSNYYINKYMFSTEPEILRQLGRMFADYVDSSMHRMAGTELGGIPLVTAASLNCNIPSILVRKSKKEYGTSNLIEGELNAGDNVLLLEDVCTTGSQIIEAAIAIEASGGNISKIVTVVDREEGARENIEFLGYEYISLFTKSDLGVYSE